MLNKKKIKHDVFSRAQIITIDYYLKRIEKYGISEYKKLFSIHRINSLLTLYPEIASNLDTLIQFKDFLYQYDYTDFLRNINNSSYIFATKDYISQSQIIIFLKLYEWEYIKQIDFLVNYLSLIVDWKEGKLTDSELDFVPQARKGILEILDTINKYGDVATEFLVRVLKYDFIGYNGNQKYVVTSSLTPEKDFADLILQGYKIVRYSRLVYDENNYPFCFSERENVNNITQTMYPSLPDDFFPILPGEEEAYKKRRALLLEKMK